MVEKRRDNDDWQTRKVKGTLTVEAAFILSFLVILVYLFLVLCLILHDRTILSATAQRIAQTAILSREEFVSPETGGIDWESYCQASAWSRINSIADLAPDTDRLAAEVEERCAITTGVIFSLQVEGSTAIVAYSASVKPVGGLYGGGSWIQSISGTESSERHQPERTLRMARAFIFKNRKGGENTE